jgi:hypothetical protein
MKSVFDIIIQSSTKIEEDSSQTSHETYPYPPESSFPNTKMDTTRGEKAEQGHKVSISASTRNSQLATRINMSCADVK